VTLSIEPHQLIGAAVILALLAGIAFCMWWFSAFQRTLRGLRRAPEVAVANAYDGMIVRIRGTIVAHGETLVAPLSGRACVHYDVHVEERVSTGKSSTWRTMFRESDERPFVVEDETGRAIVRGLPLRTAVVVDHHQRSGFLSDATPGLLALLARHGRDSTNFLGLNRTIRYREGALEPGEQVAVLGLARWEDDPAPDAIDPAAQTAYRGASARKKRLVIEAAGDAVLASDDPRALRP
jgi:hypothetical protein